MSTIHPEQTFDDEAECIPPWSRPDPGLGQKSFVYPAPAGLERRRASPRPSRQQARVGDHLADKPSAASGLTPTQWLAQWCCLEEQT
jgi:hypothetical protein